MNNVRLVLSAMLVVVFLIAGIILLKEEYYWASAFMFLCMISVKDR